MSSKSRCVCGCVCVTRQPAILLAVLSLLHSLLQVAQRLASGPEVPQQVAVLLVRDWWTLGANVDRAGCSVVVPCDWMQEAERGRRERHIHCG